MKTRRHRPLADRKPAAIGLLMADVCGLGRKRIHLSRYAPHASKMAWR